MRKDNKSGFGGGLSYPLSRLLSSEIIVCYTITPLTDNKDNKIYNLYINLSCVRPRITLERAWLSLISRIAYIELTRYTRLNARTRGKIIKQVKSYAREAIVHFWSNVLIIRLDNRLDNKNHCPDGQRNDSLRVPVVHSSYAVGFGMDGMGSWSLIRSAIMSVMRISSWLSRPTIFPYEPSSLCS